MDLAGFLHTERIHERASVHSWTISAHRHGRLSQVLLVTAGGGTLSIEARTVPFAAPFVIWLPAGVVHAFRFAPDTDGMVVTIAEDFLAETAMRGATRDGLGAAASFMAEPEVLERLTHAFDRIEQEVRHGGPGARLAIAGHLTCVLAEIIRAVAAQARSEPATRASRLCRDFRALVEQHYREHRSVPDYARDLRVSPDRLHEACRMVTGRPPTHLIHDRVMREAQRLLVYTSLGIAEIAFELGFEDPAYFSRFFSRRAGQSPAAFRAAQDRGAA